MNLTLKKNRPVFLCMLFWCGSVCAQTNPAPQAKAPTRFRGTLYANSVLYAVDGISARRDPFYWMVSGNAVLDIGEVSIPMSAVASQQNKSFTQPYNQFGLSPTYRSLTVHAGYRTMSFSEYTLSGIIFLGGGAEFTPRKSPFRLSAMYGRLQKAVQVGGQIGIITGPPTFERWGYSGKASYTTGANSIDLIFLKAKDDESSIDRGQLIQSGTDLKPAENLVVALTGRQVFLKHFTAQAEAALSAFTTDISAPETRASGLNYAGVLANVFTTRTSSQFNGAYTANLYYNAAKYSVGLVYKRIDPHYRTMGAIFLQNDRQEVTGTFSLRLAENKLNIHTNAGIQSNNLDHTQLTTTQRFIGMINAMYAWNNNWNASAGYSNFNTNSVINTAPLGINVDSLRFFQVTQSVNGSMNYTKGDNKRRHTISLNALMQDVNVPYYPGTRFYNSNVSYQLNLLPQLLTFTTAFNFNYTAFGPSVSNAYGPTLSVARQFFHKKLRVTFSSTYIRNAVQAPYTIYTYSNRLGSTFAIGKRQTAGVDVNVLNNRAPVASPYKTFDEYRGGITYGITF